MQIDKTDQLSKTKNISDHLTQIKEEKSSNEKEKTLQAETMKRKVVEIEIEKLEVNMKSEVESSKDTDMKYSNTNSKGDGRLSA